MSWIVWRGAAAPHPTAIRLREVLRDGVLGQDGVQDVRVRLVLDTGPCRGQIGVVDRRLERKHDAVTVGELCRVNLLTLQFADRKMERGRACSRRVYDTNAGELRLQVVPRAHEAVAGLTRDKDLVDLARSLGGLEHTQIGRA